jgi:ubiquinone/menaquinone biosynthesis C-methylase UbiE
MTNQAQLENQTTSAPDVITTIPATRSHPVRGRGNAGIFSLLDRYQHHKFGDRKSALFAGLPRTVVELGSGTGASMRYLEPGTRLIAIEPNVHMHHALRRQARRRGIELDIRQESAGAIGLPDGSVDAVICTLVLCTVPDPTAAVAEVHRILRPGGRFHFIEHVHAETKGLRGLQKVVHRPWRYVFEGCELERDTAATLAAAGFSELRLDHFRLGGLFVPIWPQIAGTAVA